MIKIMSEGYICLMFFYRANSLKRAVRRLVEHTEMAVDDQNDPADEKRGNKMPNITITSDNTPMNTETSRFFFSFL